MIDDHSKANADLQTAAHDQGIALPTEIDSKHKAKIDELSNLSGFDFDKAYMQDMVKDHEKDVAEFEKAAKMSGDTPVRELRGEGPADAPGASADGPRGQSEPRHVGKAVGE